MHEKVRSDDTPRPPLEKVASHRLLQTHTVTHTQSTIIHVQDVEYRWTASRVIFPSSSATISTLSSVCLSCFAATDHWRLANLLRRFCPSVRFVSTLCTGCHTHTHTHTHTQSRQMSFNKLWPRGSTYLPPLPPVWEIWKRITKLKRIITV